MKLNMQLINLAILFSVNKLIIWPVKSQKMSITISKNLTLDLSDRQP